MQPNVSIGFVPTMGALHQGHLSLIQAAQKECKQVVVSIFVNELQFGPNEDFKEYPRTLKKDISQLKAKNVTVLFLPNKDEIYPKKSFLKIEENNISKKLEGKSRPNFFSGILIVVVKLFNLVQPQYVYFGEKDIQQLYVVKQMIVDFNFSIVLRSCPTIREKTGLAMSSRNKYLTDGDKKEASILYQALMMGKSLWAKETIANIEKQMLLMLNNKNISVDYLKIINLNTFEKPINNQDLPIALIGAIYYNKVRLIDNVIIKKQ